MANNAHTETMENLLFTFISMKLQHFIDRKEKEREREDCST